MKKNKVFIIVPTYNEGKTLLKTIKSLYKYANRIVVVDDGSTDDTNRMKFGRKVVYLRHWVNLGQGAALMTGIVYSRKYQPDFTVTFDADGQFNPQDISKALALIKKADADVCLGSRFLGKTINMPVAKMITLKLAVYFTKIFSGIDLTDTHNGFRVLNKKSLNLINITQNRMAHASEFIEQIRENKLNYIEVPVTVKYTKYSLNKGQNIFNSVNIIIDLVTQKFI